MPELPEVETVRRGLQPVMEGARFTRVEAQIEVMDEVVAVGSAHPDTVGLERAVLGRDGSHLGECAGQ